MMILPFESARIAEVAALPARWEKPAERSVSRLEFPSFDESTAAAEDIAEQKPEIQEARLKQDAVLFEEQLDAKTEDASGLIESARLEARTEADRDWQILLEKKLAEERVTIVTISESFERERRRYFAAVEAEVVKLALAIAKQVLHREVKLDPLLLAGVVKVALGKVAEDSATTLRVPVADLEKWRESLASMQDNSLHLLGDEKLGPGECLLDTNVGRVELGVSAQLQEIERGFFDLLQQRPA